MLSDVSLKPKLPVAELGTLWEFHPSIGSTNDRALELAQRGAPHGTLVVSDQQTSGRGRGSRSWSTPPGCALAFSILLRDQDRKLGEQAIGASVLGALAVVEALEAIGLNPSIKWPNDVLLQGRKVAGVLAEASWLGEVMESMVLGIGVNVRAAAVPPHESLDFPATSVEQILDREVDRTDLLIAVLERLSHWWEKLGSADLLEAWEHRLAYRGMEVELQGTGAPVRGRLAGLTSDGKLLIINSRAGRLVVESGDFRLRPVDRRPD